METEESKTDLDKNEWSYSGILVTDRVACLSKAIPFTNVVADIENELRQHMATCAFTIDPGAHLVGRRVIFVFEVKDRTGDMFFNGISGYRAQYYTSPNHGLSQNRLLIDRLTPLLVEIAKARDFRKGDEVMTEDEVRASLALESAKAWGDETGDREFWSHVNGYKNRDDIEINARRWVENLGSTDIKTKRGAQRGVRAPRLRAIKIMGGFADQHGNEDVAEHKRRRHHDIHERGFS